MSAPVFNFCKLGRVSRINYRSVNTPLAVVLKEIVVDGCLTYTILRQYRYVGR